MSYFPEDVEDKVLATSKSAIKIFLFACKWRNHKDRTFRRGLSELHALLTRATFYRALAELKSAGLIRVADDHETILWIAGDFAPMEKKYKSETNGGSLKIETGENVSLSFETNAPESLKTETSSVSKMRVNSLKVETNPPTPPIRNILNSRPTETHHEEARASGDAEVGDEKNTPEKIAGFTLGEYCEMLVAHSRRVLNVITLPNEAAQMKPIEWLWRNKASPVEAIQCYDELRKQGWRKSKVDWETTHKEFPDWKYRRDNPIEIRETENPLPALTVGKPEESAAGSGYEIKPLDEAGRQAALAELLEWADDEEFLESYKKWYTDEDWKWLRAQLIYLTDKSAAVTG